MVRRSLAALYPRNLWNSIRSNPVILKEMRSRMRGWRAMVGLTAFLILIGGTVGMIYLGYSQYGSTLQGVNTRKNIGQSIFYTIYLIQLFIVILTSPGLTAGAIASEREQQTYDLLRTTLLSARSLVIGKLFAAVSFVLLLFLSSLPLQGIGFIFGGVGFGELLLGFWILVLTALAFGAIGLFFSSIVKRARIATVLSQITTMSFSVVIPILTLVGFAILDSLYYNSNIQVPDWLIASIMWLVGITSPIATAVASEIFLIEQQSYLFYRISISGTTMNIPSPWIGFSILYILLTFGFLLLTIGIIRRPEHQ